MDKIDKQKISLLGLLILFIFSTSLSNCSFNSRTNKTDKESTKRQQIIEDARSLIGTKYKYAGKSPKGFDCSGFTGYVYKKNGIWLDASSRLQAKQGKPTDIGQLEPGDLIFFKNGSRIDHVGIVSQNKKGKLFVIHSTNSQGVVEHDVFQILYWKKRIKLGRDVISP